MGLGEFADQVQLIAIVHGEDLVQPQAHLAAECRCGPARHAERIGCGTKLNRFGIVRGPEALALDCGVRRPVDRPVLAGTIAAFEAATPALGIEVRAVQVASARQGRAIQ